MKSSKIKGYLKDLENKNKNFSYDKIIRILDVSNFVYLDMIDKFDYKGITAYEKSKYLFKEIKKEFATVFELLSNGEIFMGTCLLRNVYEEIMYIMATSLNLPLDINVKTKAGYFKEKVMETCSILLNNSFDKNDIFELYGYLSKITHVTNIKEAVSYLIGNNNIKKYIVNEIKYITLLIEYMYLDFLHKKCNLESEFILNIIAISSYPELINIIYFAANGTKHNKMLEKYFYGEKNQQYLKEQQEKLIVEFKNFKIEKDNIDLSIKQISREVDKQLKERNYLEIATQILNNKFLNINSKEIL